MSTPKRTITIDTNLQSLSKRGKNKSVKNANTSATIRPKLKTNQFIRPSTLKKQLLARIKTHQQKKNTDSDATTLRDIRETKGNNAMATDNHINNNNNNNSSSNNTRENETFSQSLEYLQSLAVNRKDRKQKTKTQRTNMMNMNTPTTIAAATTATIASSPQTYLPHEPQQQPPPQVFLTAFPSEPVGMQENTSTAPIIPQFPQLQLPQFAPPVAQLVPAPAPFESYVNNYSENTPPVVLNSEPKWGCLKSGNKPTFRSFHNKTCKVSTSIESEPNNNNDNNNYTSESAPVVIDTTATTATTATTTATGSDSESESERDGPDPVALSEVLYGSRQQRLNDYRNEQVKTDKKNIEPVIKIKQTKQRIVTKKYKLGKYTNKTGPVIGVLIKNVQTQRNVERKRNEMKHIPLDTIISRLHKKRLLKVGSSAPPDVLREMYESSMLAGDIENEGNDIALHNFLAGGTDNNDTTSS
jgi:hypothetical protein